ncbi:MAG: PAS domain-containing protein [Thiolinea sp.]
MNDLHHPDLAGDQNLFVSLFILWLAHQLVTRHLSKVSQHIEQTKPISGTSFATLSLDRPRINDELQTLVDHINQSEGQIAHNYLLLQNSETSLRIASQQQAAAEKQAQLEKARALLALDIIDDALLMTDDHARITLVNSKACELLQLSEAELIGQNLDSIRPYLKSAQGKPGPGTTGIPAGQHL